MSVLHPVDWLVILAYFALIAGIVVWVAKRQKKTSDGYFLAGRELGWFVIGASIFASNIGSEHLVGLAASGATDGVAMAHYELHAWCLLVLAWVMVPFYMRSKVFTMPEFLERTVLPDRPHGSLRDLAGCLHPHKNSRWNLRGRSRFFRAAARAQSLGTGQLLDRLSACRCDHRPVYDCRRHERRRLHRSHADDRADHRLGAGNVFWITRRLADGPG